MEYAITKTAEGILLECLDGGMGSHGPRLVRGTTRTAIVSLLEAMWLRGHLSYEYYYDGSVVHAKHWERLLDDEEMDPTKLECRVTSHHDVLKLVAFAENWVRRPGFWYSRERNELRYKRPTSKKAVMASWLYQNGAYPPPPPLTREGEMTMSHFAVAVITDVEPTDEMLRASLQPWHEYECTGVEDEYVVDVDITEDWDRECYPTISEFAEDYGGTVVGDRVTRKTNPNAKWDWWQVGGRYSNRLAVRGEECDSAMVAELDWDAMRRSVTETRRRWVAECERESGLHGDELERGIREKTAGNAAWMALTEPKPRGSEYRQWLADNGYPLGAKAANCFELPPLKSRQSLTEWVESPPALSAFAYVKDGEWHQKGRMGWWAIVTDEQEGYEQEFQEMLQSLKPNQWITIVDCHI